MRSLYLSSVLILTLTFNLSGADWPRFRGPNGTGVAEGSLPAINTASPLWQQVLPGKGVSSPIVVGGNLFVQSATDDGLTRLLLCLDAATGKTVWSRELPGKVAKKHNKNSFASGTPASDGERVYCVSWDGDGISLHAYSLDGKDLWAQPLGGYVSQHGPGHSPAVYNGVVYVNVDDDQGAALKAFDAQTGSSKWVANRKPYRASYSTPSLLERPGKPAELLLGTTTEVTAYDPSTGRVVWSYPITWPAGQMPLRVVGSPVYAGGFVICACGDGGGSRYLVAINPEKSTPAKVWELKKGTPYVPAMLVKGNLLFWVADTGFATCAEAKTGKVLWQERVATKEVTSSPVLVGDKILMIAENGQYHILKAAPKFEVLESGTFGEPVFASPAVVDGKLYVRGTTQLFCFGK